MANLAVLFLVVFLLVYYWAILRRRGRGIVARRGISIGADLGALADKPRVRVNAVIKAGPDRVRLILTPEPGPTGDAGIIASSDLDLVVFLREEEFGFELLNEWEQSEASVAIVIPPGSQIVRLRSVDDLQPLTLRRVDEG